MKHKMNLLKKLLAFFAMAILVLSCSKYKEENFYRNTIRLDGGISYIDLNGAYLNARGDGTYLLYFPFGDVGMIQGPPYISGNGSGLAFFRITAEDGGLPEGTYMLEDGTAEGGFSKSASVNGINNPSVCNWLKITVGKKSDKYHIEASGYNDKNDILITFEGSLSSTGYTNFPSN